MKKTIIIIAFVFAGLLTINASGIFDAEITSDGHMTTMVEGMRIDGEETVNLNTESIEFRPMVEEGVYTYSDGYFKETFTFSSNSELDLDHELIVTIDGKPSDKFELAFSSHTRNGNLWLPEGDTEITIYIWLNQLLDFEEGNKPVTIQLGFNIRGD